MKYLIKVKKLASIEKGRIHLLLRESENHLNTDKFVSDLKMKNFKSKNAEVI